MASQRPIPSFLIFQDKDDRWRWNFLGPNGRIVAMGTESYLQRQGCIRAIRMCRGSPAPPVLIRQSGPKGAQSATPSGGPAVQAGADMLELTEAQIVEEMN